MLHCGEERYGFSFDLPDGWKRMGLSGWHWECAGQHIQMKSGPSLPEFLDPTNRTRHLWEPGSRTLNGTHLGGEPNTIAIIQDATGAAAISTVRDDMHYFFEFDSADQPQTIEAFESIVRSFSFPSREDATRVIEDLRPAPGSPIPAIHRAIQAGSPEAAREILSRAGMGPVIQRPGYTMHTLRGRPQAPGEFAPPTWFTMIVRLILLGLLVAAAVYWLRR